MKAYCINLAASKDRRKKMEAQFQRENIDVEFVEAVDAKQLDVTLENDIKLGEFANISSHRKIWLDMIEKDCKVALVFEDQCRLKEGFSQIVSELQLPERWDIIYLGYLAPRFFSDASPQLARGKPVGTWCHLVSLEGAKKLVNFDPLDFWLTPDVQLAFLPLRTFYMKNRIAWRDGTSKSIIGSNYLERGCLKWLVVGHWLAYFFKFWPILEILFITLILVLYIRLRR